MNAIARQTRPQVAIHDQKVTTTSKAIAEYFHKQHKDVLRKIELLKPDCPRGWHRRNFVPMVESFIRQDGSAIEIPVYEITRDGFTLLAMSFTGKRALAWKIAYINAFNRMEDRLLKKAQKQLAQEQAEVTLNESEAVVVHALMETVEYFIPYIKKAEDVLRAAESPLAPHVFDCWHESKLYLTVSKGLKKRCEVIRDRVLRSLPR